MESLKKSITVGDRQVYDIEKIYSRMLVIGQKRCINLREVFMYELSPVPFSLFEQYGDMLSRTKSTLTHRLAQYIMNTDTPNPVIVDGIALIYHVVWPQNGTVQTLCESMVSCVADVNIVDDVYIVFDRYKTGSIKEHERVRRSRGHAAPNHKLTLTTVLPARDIIMKNTLNKQQLAHLLCMCHVPPSVHMLGDVDNIFDHEEADVSTVSYANKFAKECKNEIQILADDTDVFVLLMHWFHKHHPNSHVTLRKFDGQIIDINVSSEMLGDPCADLLAMHALTGCDNVSYPFGKGKVNGIKIRKTNCPSLGRIGSQTSTKGQIFEAGRHFFSLLYGAQTAMAMHDMHAWQYIYIPRKETRPPSSRPSHQQMRIWHCMYYEPTSRQWYGMLLTRTVGQMWILKITNGKSRMACPCLWHTKARLHPQHQEGHCLWLQFESVCHKCMQLPGCTSILHSLLQMRCWRRLQKWVDCTREDMLDHSDADVE